MKLPTASRLMATTRNSRRSPLLRFGMTIALALSAGCFAEVPAVPGGGTGTETCPIGEVTCPCGADGACFESLVCIDDLDRCVRDDCETGSDGCPCDEQSRCFLGLACAGGICAPMSPSTTSTTTSDSSTMSTTGPSTSQGGVTMTASTTMTATTMTTAQPTTSTTADTDDTGYTDSSTTDDTSDTEDPVDCDAASGGDCVACFGCASETPCAREQAECGSAGGCQAVADCFRDRHAQGLCLDDCESLGGGGAAVSLAEAVLDCQLMHCFGGCFPGNTCD